MTFDQILLGLAALVVVAMLPVKWRLGVAVSLLLLAGGDYSAGIATGLRGAALLAILSVVLSSPVRRGAAHDAPRQARIVRDLAVGIWITLTIIGVAHFEVVVIANATLGLILLLAIARIPTRVEPATVANILAVTLGVYVLVSLIMQFTSPATAIEQGRLRGLSGNANLFGFNCLLLTVTSVFHRQGSRALAGFNFAISVWGIYASGSRTTALALAALLLGGVLLNSRLARRVMTWALVALILVSASGIALGNLMGPIWDRSLGSRSDAQAVAIYAKEVSPTIGLGFEQLPNYVHSTPLSVFSAGGILASLVFSAVIIRFLVNCARSSRTLLVIAIMALVHSLAESWLISTTGPMVALFGMLVVSVSSSAYGPHLLRQGQLPYASRGE